MGVLLRVKVPPKVDHSERSEAQLRKGNWPRMARGGEVNRKVARKPLETFKQRISELTGRSARRSMAQTVQRLHSYMKG